jgi:BON domain
VAGSPVATAKDDRAFARKPPSTLSRADYFDGPSVSVAGYVDAVRVLSRLPEAQPKRAASPATHKQQPEHSPGPVPLGDAAIAAKVESTLRQDTDVDADKFEVTVADGIVQLRGEVRSRDVIDELEARAAGE